MFVCCSQQHCPSTLSWSISAGPGRGRARRTTDASLVVAAPARSKTLAEQGAWSLAKAAGGKIVLTTILPGFIQGPALGPEVSGTLELPLRMLLGSVPLVPRVSFADVDTRDVAELHVRALNDDRASGERIIAASSPLWFREIAAALKARLGEKASRVSTREAPDWLVRTMGLFNHEARVLAPDLGKRQFYSSIKAEAILGRPLRSLGAAVTAAGERLIALNLV